MILTVDINDIKSESSEATIIATLFHHPEYIFYSEHLTPGHFSDRQNGILYLAIQRLAQKDISTIDALNILNILESSPETRRYADAVTSEAIDEFASVSDVLARHSVYEYKTAVDNVMDAAFRRDTYKRLKDCEAYCLDTSETNLEQKIYNTLDDVMVEFSSTAEIPTYAEIIDDCWAEIKARQGTGYAGIPFKFPALNEYATIERGELFIFAAEAKQGKSMMLLNCAVDMLKQDLAILYLDSELNSRLFTARILSHLTGIEFKRLTAGGCTEEENERIAEAMAWLKTRKFTHLYIPMFDQQTIYTAVKKVKHTQGLDVLIVD